MDLLRLGLVIALVVVLAIAGYSAWTKYRKHQRRRGLMK
jgi:hypothetical protein